MLNTQRMMNKPQILLVDDEKAIRKIISIVLEKEGYEVFEAADGLEARELVNIHELVAIISDINMPGSGGLELLKYVQIARPQLPVVLMTGFTQIMETKEAFALGARAFLAKPFQRDELMAALAEACETGPKKNIESIAPKVEDVPVESYCRIPIDEFLAGNTIKFEIYVCIKDDKYIKIAHTGENIAMEKIHAFKSKGVNFLYVKKEDFARYVGFNLSLVNVAKNKDSISKEKKIQLVKHASDVVMENLFVNGLDQQVFNQAKEVLESTLTVLVESNEISGLISTLSGNGDHLYAHNLGVSVFSTLIAKQIGWKSPTRLFKISTAGLFHDIGLKEIDRGIVDKPRSSMTPDEIKIYESHCVRGAEILSRIPTISDEIIQAVLQHHESADGRGYPSKLAAGKINTMARLIAVADKFCELILPAKNYPGLSPQKAVDRLSLTILAAVDVQFLIALKKVLGLDEKVRTA